MNLTKLCLDRPHPAVRQDLRDCQDMHRSLMKLFGEDRQTAGVLYRLHITKRESSVYMLSRKAPGELPPGISLVATRDVTPLVESFADGQLWRFDLLAQPCKKVAAEGRKNSRRVLLRTPEERQHWLETKGRSAGFRVLWVRESGQNTLFGEHAIENGGKMFITAVHFCGTLCIEDAQAFRTAYCTGIGPGKAYGMGMLLLSPN